MIKKTVVFYNFILVTLMMIVGFMGASSFPELLSAIFFFPLALYFGLLLLPNKARALVIPKVVEKQDSIQSLPSKSHDPSSSPHLPPSTPNPPTPKLDPDRRAFIKLIGTAGITLFLFSLFTKKAHGAFFGSMPGPGTVSIKDSSGTVIDPAASTPTDGYKISEVDDSSPAYYGFIHKNGKWFIMKETSGAYRYTKGNSSFGTNWTGRVALTYDYFNVIFA